MTHETIPGLEFEVYFETDCGFDTAIIHATSAADMVRQMRARFPDDIGADGFYNCPISGEERPLNW